MMEEEKDLMLIRDYLNNKLSASEKEVVRDRLQNDRSFEQALRETQLMMQGIKSYNRLQNLEKLQNLESKLQQKEVKPLERSRKFPLLAIAAAFALLILGILAIFMFNKPSGPDLYAQYFQPYPNVIEPTLRAEEDLHSVHKKAFLAYESGRHEEAAQFFQELAAVGNTEIPADVLSLYLGNSYLAMGSAEAAIEEFSGIDEASTFWKQAQWYQALGYLKLDKAEEAILILKPLAATSGSYAEKANELLNEIE